MQSNKKHSSSILQLIGQGSFGLLLGESEKPPGMYKYKPVTATVDGRHPTPVDMVNIPLFTQFYTSHVV